MGWLVGWLVDWLIGWLVGWLVGLVWFGSVRFGLVWFGLVGWLFAFLLVCLLACLLRWCTKLSMCSTNLSHAKCHFIKRHNANSKDGDRLQQARSTLASCGKRESLS